MVDERRILRKRKKWSGLGIEILIGIESTGSQGRKYKNLTLLPKK